MVDTRDIISRSSEWEDALLILLVSGDAWRLTRKEMAEQLPEIRRELEGVKKKKKAPCAETVSRIIANPEFRDKVQEARRERMLNAMPAAEVGMINAAILGSPQAYDRVREAAGEGKIHTHDSSGRLEEMPDDRIANLASTILERNKKRRRKGKG